VASAALDPKPTGTPVRSANSSASGAVSQALPSQNPPRTDPSTPPGKVVLRVGEIWSGRRPDRGMANLVMYLRGDAVAAVPYDSYALRHGPWQPFAMPFRVLSANIPQKRDAIVLQALAPGSVRVRFTSSWEEQTSDSNGNAPVFRWNGADWEVEFQIVP